MPLLDAVLHTALGVITGRAVNKLIDSAATAVEKPTKQQGETIMGYDLIGIDDFDDDDDDDVGAIGLDMLVGEDDDVLDALVSGDGSSEIIGAVKRGKAAKKRAVLKRLAQRKAGAVVKRELDKRRRYPLGFAVTTIAGGAAAIVPANPQNLFRAERLIIPSDIAFDLGVRDIKVGVQSQFAQNQEVPAAMFSEVAIDTGMGFDTAEIGNQVSIDVRNKTANPVDFTAALLGTVAK